MARNPRPALRRIIARAERVRTCTQGLSGDDLDRDEVLKLLVLRDLSEIARAVAGFPTEVRALRPEAPWHGLRMLEWTSEADLGPGSGRGLLSLVSEHLDELSTAAEAIIAELDARGVEAPVRVEKPLAAYQLRLSLTGIRPPIWRRLLLRNDITLRRLHNTIQEAGDWWNYHLHESVIVGMRYGRTDPDWELPHLSDAHVRLRNLPWAEGDILRYAYDFGDHWEIDILLEKVLPIAEATGPARCLAGARAFPHEDAGGVAATSSCARRWPTPTTRNTTTTAPGLVIGNPKPSTWKRRTGASPGSGSGLRSAWRSSCNRLFMSDVNMTGTANIAG